MAVNKLVQLLFWYMSFEIYKDWYIKFFSHSNHRRQRAVRGNTRTYINRAIDDGSLSCASLAPRAANSWL